jgi:GNAT superfamily N-acetyltransferase
MTRYVWAKSVPAQRAVPTMAKHQGQLRNASRLRKLEFSQMPERFEIRLATPDDVDAIAEHRARMFDEMGEVPPGTFEILRTKSRARLQDYLNRGEYVGWLAILAQRPEIIAGGAGVQLREVLPHPLSRTKDGNRIAEGRHAIIINVFTEPQWRRQGVALLLLQRIIDWARAERLDRLVLHASEAGRSLYERLGFVGTNEMRLTGESEQTDDAIS